LFFHNQKLQVLSALQNLLRVAMARLLLLLPGVVVPGNSIASTSSLIASNLPAIMILD
jgi:hypothetical protein